MILVLLDEQVWRNEPSREGRVLDADRAGVHARAQVGLGHHEVLPPICGGVEQDLPRLVGPVVRDVVTRGVDESYHDDGERVGLENEGEESTSWGKVAWRQ